MERWESWKDSKIGKKTWKINHWDTNRIDIFTLLFLLTILISADFFNEHFFIKLFFRLGSRKPLLGIRNIQDISAFYRTKMNLQAPPLRPKCLKVPRHFVLVCTYDFFRIGYDSVFLSISGRSENNSCSWTSSKDNWTIFYIDKSSICSYSYIH